MNPIALAAALIISAAPAIAGVCDYRLSELLGSDASATIGASGAAVAGAGLAGKAAGVYIIVHSTSGATMLGSTLAGTSAAGTVGIIGGTSGVLGTLGAIVTAPVTLIAAGVTAVGVGVLEGGCYFADERITEFPDVYRVLKAASVGADPAVFQLHWTDSEHAYILINYDGTGLQKFMVDELYIVNGELMHSDWFANTSLGYIAGGTKSE